MAETKINASQTSITASDIGALSASNESTATVGQVLTKTATGAEWDDAQGGGSSLPDMTGHRGEFLTTDGTDASWVDLYSRKYLQNASTGTGGLCIEGNGNTYSYTVYIGYNTSANTGGVVVGADSNAGGQYAVALGYHAWGQRDYSIQIGYGENWTANTMSVGLSDSNNYRLLDSDGTIPEARLADTTNAAEGQVLTLDSNLNAVWQTPSGGGSGSSLPDMTGQSGKFLTTDGTDASWGTINALQNIATGSNALTIEGTPATGGSAINIGYGSSAVAWGLAIGRNAISSNDSAVAVGSATASGYNSVAMGLSAVASASRGVAIGPDAQTSSGSQGVAIGGHAKGNADNAVAIGYGAEVSGECAAQIGQGTNSEAGTLCFGTYTAQGHNINYKILDRDGTIPAARHAALPSADGTYVLKLVIADGVPTLSWVAE